MILGYFIDLFFKIRSYIINYLYECNTSMIKWDMIRGTSLSVITAWWVDMHIDVVKIIGMGMATFLSIVAGTVGPMLIRLWMHKLRSRSKFIDSLLKHDRKEE